MSRMNTWCVVLVALVLAVGLAGCKSNTSCKGPNCAAPSEQAPTFADGSLEAVPPRAPSWEEAPTLPAQPAASQADVDAARDSAALATRKAEDLARRLADEEAQRIANERRIREMEQKLADLERPPAGDLPEQPPLTLPEPAPAERLLEELRARSQADVLREGDLVIVRVTNGFKSGSDMLKSDVQLMTTLNATADTLARHYPGARVSVVGHSDGDPIVKSGWESNEALSLARAQRVAQVLKDNGVSDQRIQIAGEGFRNPLIAQERSAADKARNRRVEIMIRL